uniref:BRCT domain-containing protein n=1 Tax=Cucumis sativus TaxID=3659 RepID=A0A0A0KCR3_CUCSA
MAPFGSDRVDIDRTDTEVFDGYLSPPTYSGEETDKTSYSSGTVDFYDDEFETQVVNLDGETQVVNHGETQVVNLDGETQVVEPVNDDFETQLVNPLEETQVFDVAYETQILSFCDETQLLDDPIPDCVKKMDFDTQILNDFDDEMAGDDFYDDEGTETTETNVDDNLPDDESAQRFHQSVEEKGQLTSSLEYDARKDLEVLPNTLPEKNCNSGPTRLSSLRTASLRASGLAAHCSAMKTRDAWPSVIIDKDKEKSSLKDSHVDRHNGLGQSSVNDGDSGNVKCRVGSSAVRKLFTDDYTPVGDFGDLPTKLDASDVDLHQLTACDGDGDQLAGLSYVDSQEPGDLTQDNALDFVEKFLKDNSMEFGLGVGMHKRNAMVQPKSVPNPRGQYNLASIVNCVRVVGESRVFDWDDNREDEGGGDIFRRRKEEFLTEPRKSKGRKLDLSGDKEASMSNQNMKSRLFCSDSRLELRKGKGNNGPSRESNIECKRNLSYKLDKENDGDPCRGELQNNGIQPDQLEEANVGFDTQMAAEAMEALFNDANIHELVHNETNQHLENGSTDSFRGSPSRKSYSSSKLRRSSRGHASSSEVAPMQSKIRNQKFSGVITKACGDEIVKLSNRSKKRDADAINGNENIGYDLKNACNKVQKRLLRGKVVEVSPVACRTRHSIIVNQSKKAKIASSGCERSAAKVGSFIKKSSGDRGTRDFEAKRTKSLEAASKTLKMKSKGAKNDAKRSIGERGLCDMLAGEASLPGDLLGQTMNRRKRSCNVKKTRASLCLLSPPSNKNLKRPTVSRTGAEKAHGGTITADTNDQLSIEYSNRPNSVQQLNKKNDGCSVSSVVKTTPDESPSKRHKPSVTVCTSPSDNSMTPINSVSPVCMGSEYYKQSCKKNLSKSSLLKELRDLTSSGFVSRSCPTESRKRKDMTDVRVLYSQHLDEGIIKQQKKTLTRLGVTVVSSMAEATHFIADKFVRTRNMLEAIALGKLVVTHLWIDSCGQASCFIDEKNHILRDTKKEKEVGFSMPGSLACARQRPLLEGRRVLITPNTKPGIAIISSLVKVVKGQAVERIGRSMLKDDQIPDDLLVLSCEEDYNTCLPFLEKGAAVYSSELLLNGIVTQKLEFERHRIFVDHVKRTRSTIWLKKDGNKFQPVTKHQ